MLPKFRLCRFRETRIPSRLVKTNSRGSSRQSKASLSRLKLGRTEAEDDVVRLSRTQKQSCARIVAAEGT
jgi:hypothetical protein